MTDIETIIVIHPPFAWLLDWPAIVSPTQRWYLVTTPASLARLQREDKLRAFCATHASSTFSEQALAPIIEPWVRAQPDSSRVRILSMIEPVQLAVAQLRERFATPGPSVRAATTFTNKLAMKSAMTGVDDLLPAHVAFDRSEFERAPHEYARAVFAKLGGPLFVKPLAENSSVDTARIDDPQQLVAHLHGARADLEIDEYIDGDGFHLDSVIVDGRVAWFGAGWYLAPQGQTLHGKPLAGAAIAPNDALFEELRALNQRLLSSFDRVPDGCTHMEVLRRRDGRWVFLEVAARVPGARVVETYEITRGINLRHTHYQLLAGLPVDLTERRGPYAGYYCPMKTEPGVIERVVSPPFSCAHRGEWDAAWITRTDTAKSMAMADCMGVFILWDEDQKRVRRELEALEAYRPYVLA
jgi:hypothetical protein